MIEHFSYPLPYNDELREQELIPYKCNSKLKNKIHYLFAHVKFEHRQLYLDVFMMTKGLLLESMANVAVGCMRYFLLHPQQFAHKADNIHLQILVRMWKQVFKFTRVLEIEINKYYATKMVLMSIDNGFIEELIRTCENEDYWQTNDDMVKPLKERGIVATKNKVMYDNNWKKCSPDIRARKSLGTSDEDSKNFRALVNIAENEQGSLL